MRMRLILPLLLAALALLFVVIAASQYLYFPERQHQMLVDALEAMARSRGIVELWLLTIDADAWFARLNYLVRERDDAPVDIRNTREFSGLCPGDAVLMSKRI